MDQNEPKLVKDEEFPVKPGSVLPNSVGCVLLDESVVRQHDHRRDSIVLAVDTGGHQAFVTWQRIVSNDERDTDGQCHLSDYVVMGHYHQSLDKAVEEFKHRVDEKMDMIEQSARLRAEAS